MASQSYKFSYTDKVCHRDPRNPSTDHVDSLHVFINCRSHHLSLAQRALIARNRLGMDEPDEDECSIVQLPIKVSRCRVHSFPDDKKEHSLVNVNRPSICSSKNRSLKHSFSLKKTKTSGGGSAEIKGKPGLYSSFLRALIKANVSDSEICQVDLKPTVSYSPDSVREHDFRVNYSILSSFLGRDSVSLNEILTTTKLCTLSHHKVLSNLAIRASFIFWDLLTDECRDKFQ
uniref:Uncharacterized protein n=1 Tax=viral metagenome TaxID=1070528 RepID=A0A6C0J3V0_9ZZZZ